MLFPKWCKDEKYYNTSDDAEWWIENIACSIICSEKKIPKPNMSTGRLRMY